MSKGFGNMMRQAQNMQKKMKEAQEGFEKKIVEGEAGQGAVKVEVKGSGKLSKIKLDPEIIDPEDAETLEDLIVVAVNDATDKAKEMREEATKGITGGMNIPGLF